MRTGESGSVLRIPIVEGNRDLADRNILIGSLEITAEKVKRDPRRSAMNCIYWIPAQ